MAPISVPAIVLGFSLLYLLSSMLLGISFLALLITHTVVAVPYVAWTALAVYRHRGWRVVGETRPAWLPADEDPLLLMQLDGDRGLERPEP